MGPAHARACMALTSDKADSVPQFNGVQDNFLFWQARIRALLIEKGAHDALSRSKAHVISQAHLEEANKACSVILRGLGDVPMAAVIRYVDDPKKMWDVLAERFAGTSTFNKASVQTALAKLRYTGEPMEKYVAQYENLAAKLDAMQAAMDESLLITSILPVVFE